MVTATTTSEAPVKFLSFDMSAIKAMAVVSVRTSVSFVKATANFAIAVAMMCPAVALTIVAFVAAYSVPLNNLPGALGADIAFAFPYLCATAAFVVATWITGVAARSGVVIVMPGAEEDPNAEVIDAHEISDVSDEPSRSKAQLGLYLFGALIAAKLLIEGVKWIWVAYPGLLDVV